ncbi:MAG: HigA family addiction module antidote protein [Magnetospirillum sp.]|nr:HigA family addiction module antidote protein [Magnetospirillum sp.]
MTIEYNTPGQLIADLLEARGWSQRTLAVVLEKDESTINKIVSGKGSVTTETALALEDVFGVEAERFLELQRKYDLAIARISSRPDRGRATRAALFGDLPIAEMIKRGWISANNVHDLKAVESGLVKFFGVSCADEIEVLPHAARKTMVNTDPTPAQLAWLYRVKAIAEDLLVSKYSKDSLDSALNKLHELTVAPEEARKVSRILTECGVRFVIVESLPSAKIDGVCFWLDDHSPVIGLSMRHDRIDNFWFVLRHELEHVRLGHGRSAMMLDTDLDGERAGTGPDIPEEEQMANAAAQEFCVPSNKMNGFITRKAPFFSERDLLGFAKILSVHPGIVAGQLQYRTGRYDRFRQHLATIRSHVMAGAAIDGWGDVYPLGE